MKDNSGNTKEDIVRMAGAAGAVIGMAPAGRLTSPPSADPNFVLPGARSVIALLMPMDGDIVRRYLAGEDQLTYTEHDWTLNLNIYALAEQIARLLQTNGHRAIAVPTNRNYRYLVGRRGTNPAVFRRIISWVSAPSGRLGRGLKRRLVDGFVYPQLRRQDWDLIPTFSHRYAAVAAGLGGIGWSGNLVSARFGARVVLDSVITDAELPPDPMLDSSPCDGCRTCAAVCQSGYISPKETQQTTINGVTFTHNRHGHNARCTFVCGGLSGQSRYQQWATWSPARVRLPDSDDGMKEWFELFIKDNLWRGNMYSPLIRDLFLMGQGIEVDSARATCTFCRAVCWQSREERQENYRLIRAAGERTGPPKNPLTESLVSKT